MCYRFALEINTTLPEVFHIDEVEGDIDTGYNISLGANIPVVVERNNKNYLSVMKWGLIPSRAKDEKIGYKMGNARSETIFEKPSFSKAVISRRCIIPASGFFEREHQGKEKLPHFISPTEMNYFGFAGIYELWQNSDNETILSTSILTTEPNALVSKIHKRMPVILSPNNYARWLSQDIADKETISSCIDQYPADSMQSRRVTTDMNNSRFQGSSAIQKI